MKKILFAFMAAVTALSAAAYPRDRIKLNSIEPPYWWTGMVNDTLQLLINGVNVADANITVDYPGVKVVADVPTDSPNYKLLYLTIAPDTKPGEMILRFDAGRRGLNVPYELKERRWKGTDNPGFDASDVLYLIMPDRFADGDTVNNNVEMRHRYVTDRSNLHTRHGGDIAGMLRHLDYIDSLGVTAIWVNPVLENDVRGGSYHGYATSDYYRIDPRFGTNEEWAEFVDAAHARGLKVVMDMIFNHSAITHPWIEDMPMADWYNHPEADVMTNFRLTTLHDPYASDYDRDATVNGWFVRGMPDLNQRNPHVRDYLIQNSIFWIEDSHIDGIRMDTYPYADAEAMARWTARVEEEYPAFNIVGECWYESEGSEAFWQRGSKVNPVDPNLPTVMDFYIATRGSKAFSEPRSYDKLYDHLSLDFLYPDPQSVLVFLDNHDTDRFLAAAPDDLGLWKQAVTFLLTSRGIPQIYYGTEILMDGLRADGGDGNVRRDMPGGFVGDAPGALQFVWDTPMQGEAFDYISRLLHWRRDVANDIIARGSLKHFLPQDNVYVYERRLGDDSIVVILNGNDRDADIDMARYAEILPAGATLTDFVSGNAVAIADKLHLTPRQTLILTK